MQRDLVVRAQRGDLDAFSALTAGTTDRLFGAARLILRDDEHAADAVQDALLQAWLDIRGLRDPDRFDAWLHRLLVRACYRAAPGPRGLAAPVNLRRGGRLAALSSLGQDLAGLFHLREFAGSPACMWSAPDLVRAVTRRPRTSAGRLVRSVPSSSSGAPQ